MYLKRLEINGFKSFAQKTALDFITSHAEHGGERMITAIVGPNGSGKSNVADAIRWAIGEQSSKNLRGKKSEDVIFAGTDKKARLGSASVTLYFDNADKRIPIEFAEVSITRKLYRSGESEYLINGSKVRLLDITDLLARAGIGRDSYSVITQGMSDALLAASPVERRSIFEDAAGVKPYQIEKERSQRKLAATEENLTKVAALLLEIEPHLKNLKRQAEKAAQGKDIAARLSAKQHALYGFLWKNFEAERGKEAEERERLEKDLFELEIGVNTLKDEVKKASSVLENQAREEELLKTLSSLREDARPSRQRRKPAFRQDRIGTRAPKRGRSHPHGAGGFGIRQKSARRDQERTGESDRAFAEH
ncbi:MAG: AAA family ATPase [Candidatus Moraniibacteriota bacterium]